MNTTTTGIILALSIVSTINAFGDEKQAPQCPLPRHVSEIQAYADCAERVRQEEKAASDAYQAALAHEQEAKTAAEEAAKDPRLEDSANICWARNDKAWAKAQINKEKRKTVMSLSRIYDLQQQMEYDDELIKNNSDELHANPLKPAQCGSREIAEYVERTRPNDDADEYVSR